MPVKIRLSRHGRKRAAFYHIVVADGRAPRDGKYIERIGSYNPNTNPATIELDFDRALEWVQKGAQPTDTARAILSYEGVMHLNHLLVGVKKGALTEDQAKAKFEAWKKEKATKIQAKVDNLLNAKNADKTNRLEAEKKINETRAEELAKKSSELAAELEKAEAEENKVEEVKVEATTEEVKTEEVKEVKAEKKEEVKEEKKEEKKEEEKEEEKEKKEETKE